MVSCKCNHFKQRSGKVHQPNHFHKGNQKKYYFYALPVISYYTKNNRVETLVSHIGTLPLTDTCPKGKGKQ
jgi:hypothetical protein